mmetsp:Transcript_11696/g.30786  ORF Transcript_11696/g.30786 Transcript_11696/m.30786 type:complete len:200 (-) Transcript_11696:427-1026(-)
MAVLARAPPAGCARHEASACIFAGADGGGAAGCRLAVVACIWLSTSVPRGFHIDVALDACISRVDDGARAVGTWPMYPSSRARSRSRAWPIGASTDESPAVLARRPPGGSSAPMPSRPRIRMAFCQSSAAFAGTVAGLSPGAAARVGASSLKPLGAATKLEEPRPSSLASRLPRPEAVYAVRSDCATLNVEAPSGAPPP